MTNGDDELEEEPPSLEPLKVRIEELRGILRGFTIRGEGVSGSIGTGYTVDRGADIDVEQDPIDNCG
jgi:hypothetical protein